MNHTNEALDASWNRHLTNEDLQITRERLSAGLRKKLAARALAGAGVEIA